MRTTYQSKICTNWLSLGLLLWCSAHSVSAQEKDCEISDGTPVNNLKVAELDVTSHAIFDESEPDILAIHRWANWLHINTQEDVVESRLPFKEGDEITAQDVAEAERLIRNEPYLRDAVVDILQTCDGTNNVKVEVRTWDNWSTLPTLNFSRKGGENRFAVGLNEDNLLGMGIRTRLLYQSDAQRTGYRFSFRSPVPYVDYATAFLDIEDNDDGQRVQLTYDQPFYTYSTEFSVFADLLLDKRTEEVFQNGETRNFYMFDGRSATLSYGRLWDKTSHDIRRVVFGVTLDEAEFSTPQPLSLVDQQNLPENRKFAYPWTEFQWLQADYQVLRDVYLINQKEDINLGWQHHLKLGVESAHNTSDAALGYHLSLISHKGFQWQDSLLLFDAQLQADIDVAERNYWQLTGQGEYFYRANELFGLYAKLAVLASDNRYGDFTNALGGENGLRGYPLQYQHGDNSVSATAELRYYPQLNVLKLFDMGFVAFVDSGRAWSGKAALDNEQDRLLSSAGIGARIYSNRSSHRNVIHLDFATPLSQAQGVDTWQWRVTVKESF